MNTKIKLQNLIIIGVILFLLIPIPFNFLNFDNNLFLDPETGQIKDFVDDVNPRIGRIIGFNNMREDNNDYATLFEETLVSIYNLLDIDFIFENVDFNHDVIELHIVLHEYPRDILNVYVGSSPTPSSNVGVINRMGDNVFNVKAFLQNPNFYVKIRDSSVGNYGPYLIERMYLLIVEQNIPPSVEAGFDQNVNEGDLVIFSGSFIDPDEFDTHTIEWDFGDGTTIFGTLTPFHNYYENGIYTVTLTVSDNHGGIDSDNLIVTVNNVAPVVVATEDQYTQEGTEISLMLATYTDQGLFDTHNAIINWGDGTIEPGDITEPSVPMEPFSIHQSSIVPEGTVSGTHTYGDNGIYNVIVNIIDDDGGVGSDSLTITVNNVVPTVDAGDDQMVNEGDLVSFNGDFYDPGDLDTHNITWDFGDGSTATGTLTPTHIYGDNGIYTVILTITDDDGGVGSDSLIINVDNTAPIVIIGNDQVVNEGDLVSFNGDFLDPGDLDTHIIEWDFGDGSIATGILTPTHTYGDNGIFIVNLTVTDDDGGVSSDSLIITVNNVVPIVVAGDNQIINEGDLVSFNGDFYDPGDLDTHIIEWDFGDGSTATGTLTPSHLYVENGIYTVILTITDDDGGVGSDSLTIIVNNVAPIVDAGDDLIVNEGDLVSFNGDFYDPGDLDTHSITWDFGDGSIVTETLTPSHLYVENGIYIVILTITDDDGGVGSDSLTIIINNVAPTVDAGDDLIVNEGDLVSFNGDFYDPGDLDTHSITWDFGDGSTATGTLTPTHIYGDNGIYTIILTITDDDGGVGSDNLVITVNNIAPSVNISGMKKSFNTVNVTGYAYDPGCDDLTFIWDWDDGSSNTISHYLNDLLNFPFDIEENVEHIYNLSGEFMITLTVMDDDGGIGTDSINIRLMNPRNLKIEALLDLEQLKIGNRCFDKKVDHVIKFIKKSLCEDLWLNATHLNPRKGWLVFVFETIAIRYFEKFLLTESNKYIIEKLVRADEMLAIFALEDAKNTNIINPKFKEKYKFYLLKSEQHLNEAMIKFENEEFICAMIHYLISWKYAQFAMKWANKIIHCCKCK